MILHVDGLRRARRLDIRQAFDQEAEGQHQKSQTKKEERGASPKPRGNASPQLGAGYRTGAKYHGLDEFVAGQRSDARWMIVAPPLMNTSTNCDVATANCTGKWSSVIMAGTWMAPPPIPKRLDSRPTPRLSVTPCHSRVRVAIGTVAFHHGAHDHAGTGQGDANAARLTAQGDDRQKQEKNCKQQRESAFRHEADKKYTGHDAGRRSGGEDEASPVVDATLACVGHRARGCVRPNDGERDGGEPLGVVVGVEEQ